MAKSIAAYLILHDKMSGKLLKISKNFDNLSKEGQQMARASMNYINKLGKPLDRIIGKTLKWGAVTAAALGGFAIKQGFSKATDLETFRQNLETVTKSAERAREAMRFAINIADISAFDDAPVIEAASMLETYGLKTEDYLTAIGDAAAITGRDISEMAKAFGKASVSGQFDSLADIGITRVLLNDFAKSKGISLFKGTQVRDAKVFADTLKEYMNLRYAGGMEKQSKTIAGMWSTVTGTVTTSLARILGMTETGEIRAGSALERVRGKINLLLETVERWQRDGTIERLSARFTAAFDKIFAAAERVFVFVSQNWGVLLAVAGTAVGVWALTKAWAALTAAAKLFNAVMLILNGTLSISPLWLIAGAVAALIAWFVQANSAADDYINTLYGVGGAVDDINSKKIDNGADQERAAYAAYQTPGAALARAEADTKALRAQRDADIEAGRYDEAARKKYKAAYKEAAGVGKSSQLTAVGNAFVWMGRKIEKLFISSGLGDLRGMPYAKNAEGNHVISSQYMSMSDVLGENRYGDYFNLTNPDENALGTNYYRGGSTLVGERGPELVTLPRGSKIDTASHTRAKLGGGGNVIQIYIEGAQRSDEEIAEKVADRLMEVLDNT